MPIFEDRVSRMPTSHKSSSSADSFRRDKKGSIAVQFAFALPILLLVVGGAIDFSLAFSQRSWLQSSIDSAALSAAGELSLSDAQRDNVPAIVKAAVAGMLKANGSRWEMPQIKTTIRTDPLEVEVAAVQKISSAFGPHFGLTADTLEVKAVARVVGRPNICVLALEPSSFNAVWLVDSARMTGNNCAVFSNSRSSRSVEVANNAQLTASTVCSAGGVNNSGDITPPPIMDCPQFADPLAGRMAPTIGPCDHNELEIQNETRTLSPGVYCGGLRISGNADVNFEPGDYVIKDKSFIVTDGATIEGEYVSFYLDERSWLHFGKSTKISFSANKTGVMAGLLFFGSRNQSKLITHTILSENAQNLVGTIYMPQNSLVIDGDAAVGGSSAYTAIVARRVVLMNGPHLVLNSNYSQTDVPVPEGIKGAGQPIQLTE